MLPVPARLTTTSFIAWVANTSRPARSTRRRASVSPPRHSPRRARRTASRTPCRPDVGEEAQPAEVHADEARRAPPSAGARQERASPPTRRPGSRARQVLEGDRLVGRVRAASAVGCPSAPPPARAEHGDHLVELLGEDRSVTFPMTATVLKGGSMGPLDHRSPPKRRNPSSAAPIFRTMSRMLTIARSPC